MARKTHPYSQDLSFHSSAFCGYCSVFSSIFLGDSPYLNGIGGHPTPRLGTAVPKNPACSFTLEERRKVGIPHTGTRKGCPYGLPSLRTLLALSPLRREEKCVQFGLCPTYPTPRLGTAVPKNPARLLRPWGQKSRPASTNLKRFVTLR